MSSTSPRVSTVRTSERFDWDNASRTELVKTPLKPAFLPDHAALKTRALLLLPVLLPTYTMSHGPIQVHAMNRTTLYWPIGCGKGREGGKGKRERLICESACKQAATAETAESRSSQVKTQVQGGHNLVEGAATEYPGKNLVCSSL